MFKLTAAETATLKAIELKQSLNRAIAQFQDEYGYGQASKAVPGWKLELFFTPHSNQGISFTATNSNGGVYNFELDLNKANQGWLVINGSNQTASILLSDWLKELMA